MTGTHKAPAAGQETIDLDRIRPGMSAEEMERVRAGDRARGVADPEGTLAIPGQAAAITDKQGERMAAITSTNVANAIVKLVAADALPALMGNLVMGNLVNRDYEPVLAQAGDTVNIPIPPTLVANNIAEGGTVTDAESEPGQRADRAEHSRGSDLPDPGRDQGSGGAGPAEDLHAAGRGSDCREDRDATC